MGWGTSFKTEVYLSRKTFDNKYQVEQEIEEMKEWIQDSKAQLYMLAIANPKDLIPSDWTEEPVRFIKNEVDRLMESIDENLIDLYKLELLLENYQEPAKE